MNNFYLRRDMGRQGKRGKDFTAAPGQKEL
jgi:hypothetical protein